MGVQNEANWWVKISVGLWFNRKWRRLCAQDPRAAILWINSLSFSGMTLSDGAISADAIDMMGGTSEQVRHIVDVGLGVDDSQGGFVVHDYAKYQRTSDEIAAMKKKRSEAGRKGGLRAKANRMSKREIREVDEESRVDHEEIT